jgi:predicted esterase
VLSVDYQGIADPQKRVQKLLKEARGIDDNLLLVGSSMGGYVATAAAGELGAAGLFVLAPAYFMEGFGAPTPDVPGMPICIVHGWRDEIVPVENSIRFASKCRATLHVLDGDHRLTANIEEINDHLEKFIEKLEEK